MKGRGSQISPGFSLEKASMLVGSFIFNLSLVRLYSTKSKDCSSRSRLFMRYIAIKCSSCSQFTSFLPHFQRQKIASLPLQKWMEVKRKVGKKSIHGLCRYIVIRYIRKTFGMLEHAKSWFFEGLCQASARLKLGCFKLFTATIHVKCFNKLLSFLARKAFWSLKAITYFLIVLGLIEVQVHERDEFLMRMFCLWWSVPCVNKHDVHVFKKANFKADDYGTPPSF